MCPVKDCGETSSACSLTYSFNKRRAAVVGCVGGTGGGALNPPAFRIQPGGSSHEGISSGHVATKGRRSGCNFHWVGCSVNHQKALAGSGTVGAGSNGGGCGVE